MEVKLSGNRAFFPRVCSKCLAPNPERNFKIEGSTSRGKKITTWSYGNVPICNSCYKRKHWTSSNVLRIIGWFLLFLGFVPGIFVFSLFLPIEETTRFAFLFPGIGLVLLIGVTIYRQSNPRPVKMTIIKTSPPEVAFFFENQKYGQMFNNTNRGSYVTSVDSFLPESKGPSVASFLKIMSYLIGIMFTFAGIMTLASAVILARITPTLPLGAGSLLFGALSLFAGYSFGKRTNRKAGLLLICGLVIFVITIPISLALE